MQVFSAKSEYKFQEKLDLEGLAQLDGLWLLKGTWEHLPDRR